MRATILSFALAVCAWAPAPVNGTADQQAALLQGNTELSAAAKRKPPRSAAPGAPYQPRYRVGPPDPSLGPDGRPYPVPEYLRNQCHIDEGYGRFSACPNRG